ncbi:hypothetical protein DFH06DRAFT_1240563 [Mycena polygramma]|nr:hypothetical protein DFH06DRAFT_1240563 [Mycena polygramma]
MSAGPKTALILGATGQVGGHLLKELLANPDITRVGEFGRRTTALESLTTGKDKLEQKVLDFEKPDEAGLAEGNWDLVFIALGTSAKAAGSPEAFERIDREYVINAARAAQSASHPQRVVYVSSMGANPNARFLYPRSETLRDSLDARHERLEAYHRISKSGKDAWERDANVTPSLFLLVRVPRHEHVFPRSFVQSLRSGLVHRTQSLL